MIGLGIALAAGVYAVFFGDAFFTGQWWFIGADRETGRLRADLSVLVFDIGVYLVVFGSILTLVLALEEEV
jgi:multicomponent Na+:H+ antiporter subunit B